MTKVLVLGNCQARPLAMLLERFAGFETLDPVILHLAKDTDQAAHEAAMAEADLILAQRTDDGFGVAHLRSSHIRQTQGDRCVVWPNIFYAGQQPYLRYLNHRPRGRIGSPLGDYHDLRILRDWFRDRQGADFAAEITAPGFAETQTEKSLLSLRQREMNCDVTSADIVTELQNDRPLFFTFNHPNLWLLARLAERILAHIGRPVEIDIEGVPEPLGRIKPPGDGRFVAMETEALQGVDVTLEPGPRIAMGRPRPTRLMNCARPSLTAMTMWQS